MTQHDSSTRPPIAVVGLSALFPGSTSSGGFWRDILAGRDLLTDVPETHWLPEDYFDPDPAAPDKTYARRGGFLADVDFDALHWGVPPSILEATDTSQLLALIVAEQVLRDAAGGQFETMDRSRISCILGVTSAQELLGTMVSRLQRPIWRKSLREHGLPESEVEAVCQRIADHYVPWQESSFPGLLGNVVAGRIANRLDLGGTNCVTDAACASTFSALSMAVRELYLGDSDLVITGGVDTLNDIFMFMCFSKTPALSMTGDCRPFSDQADGTMLGEGLGMVALKRLDDAERDGDRIYAVLSGVGSSSDGRSKSVYAPVSEGQAAALRRAYEHAGFTPETIELVEAHGTGTKAGDAAEFGGLSLAFDCEEPKAGPWCALGSVKSQIGHTKAAAGAAGLFKAVMALHHKVLPPTIKVDKPSEKLDIEGSPFFINTEARPWIRGSDHPRRAGVSSFGFGGSNFHLALEEYQGENPRADRVRSFGAELVAISGADGATVADRARELARRSTEAGMLQRIAWESALAYQADAPARLAVVAADEAQLAERLQQAADSITSQPNEAFSHPDGSSYGVGGGAAGVAFLFPGQGSQYLRMGSDLAMALDVARSPWDRAADLDLGTPQRIDQVVFPLSRFSDEERAADKATLQATEWAQPAIGATSLSLLALMDALGVRPQAVAGHSFGEVTALHAAGVLSESDLLRVARKRGELMAAASELPGAMTAVSAELGEVHAVLEALDRNDVVVANHNAPTQVVVSGTIDGIEAAELALTEAGSSFKRLPVATAFHSPVVAASATPFGEFLAGVDFTKPTLPVWSGESAELYETDSGEARQRLARQIANPVRFVDLLQGLSGAGIDTFIEVGPGTVLTGLVGRSLDRTSHRAIALDRRGQDGIVSLSRGLAQLVAAGVSLDLGALWEGYGEPEDILQRVQPKLAVPISGSNHGKHYPPEGGAAALPQPNPPRVEPALPAVSPPSPPVVDAVRTADVAPLAPAPSAPASARVEIPMTAPKSVPTPPSAGWLAAWQEALQQSAQAHTAFQQSMAQSHNAYLATMETSIAALAGLAGAAVPTGQALQGLPAAQPLTTAPAPALVTAAPPAAVSAPPAAVATPIPMAAPAAPAVAPVAPAVVRTPQPTPIEAAPAPAPAPAAPAPAAPTVDLHGLMLAVVSDKTGYPAEMLDLSMNLEGDLGIDSIKRVEILAAVQEQAPGMPDVDPAHMSTLTTLGQIVDYMQGLMGAPAAPAASAPAPVAPASTPGSDLGRYVLELVHSPALGLAQPALLGAGEVLVTRSGTGLADVLANLLRTRGVQATAVDTVSDGAQAVIFLGGLRPTSDPDEAIAIEREAFGVARTLAPALTEKGGLFVTVQDTGGAFGTTPFAADRAFLAGIPALVKTASQEWPLASLKAIDLACGDRELDVLACALADELLLGGGDIEVGLGLDGVRRTPRSVRVPVQPTQTRIAPDDVVVVSGGARGVTAACVVEWARDTQARFVLLGRSELAEEPVCCSGAQTDAELKRVLLADATSRGEKPSPASLGAQVRAILSSREIRATLAAVEAAGGQARYRSASVTDAAAVDAVLAETRSDWGPIAGLVHGAGVLADRKIADQTDEQFNAVFDTKIEGLRVLLQALQPDPLKVLCLFSSVSARCGNNGQSTYAMANEVLNKLAWAESRARGGDVLVKSMGWGPWEGGMVSPQLRAHFAQLGVPMIPLELGARMLADELKGAQPDQVEVVLGGEPRPEALLVVGSEARSLRLEVALSRETHAYLAGHTIDGEVVVPVVLALEWFNRVARAFRPDLHLDSVRDLKVLKGIRLLDFDGGGDRLVIACRQLSNGHGALLGLELLSPAGTVHYRAEVQMTERQAVAPSGDAPSLSLNDWGGGPIYGDVLFHKDNFQVIRALDGVADDGISGTLAGVEQAEWGWEQWDTDVAAMDGGLQLILLWAQDKMGGAALPMGIGEIRMSGDSLPEGPIQCVARCRAASKNRGVADVSFHTEGGARFAELLDVEVILRPEATRADS